MGQSWQWKDEGEQSNSLRHPHIGTKKWKLAGYTESTPLKLLPNVHKVHKRHE